MCNDRARLYERIEKLLALSQSSNPNEAAAALARAQKMMRAHGISAVDLDTSSIVEHESVLARGLKQRTVVVGISTIIRKCFGVFAFTVSKGRSITKLIFVGPGDRVESAVYACVFLQRQLKIAVDEYRRIERDKQQEAYTSFFLDMLKYQPDRQLYFKAVLGRMPKSFAEIKTYDLGNTELRYIRSAVQKAVKNYTLGWLTAVYKKLEVFAQVSEDERVALDKYLTHKHPDLRITAKRTHRLSNADYEAYKQGMEDAQDGVKLYHGLKGESKTKLLTQ